MALNFPSNTDLPYVDPVSGLKYIYNNAVGAWETAIQPPAVVSSTVPTELTIPGFLWWDDVGGSLYIYYDDGDSKQWVEAVPTGDDIRRVGIGELPPANALDGDMWWDSTNGRLYIYYVDASGEAWIDASPNVPAATNLTFGSRVFQGTTSPPNPQKNDLWFNTTENDLYIYFAGASDFSWLKVTRDPPPAAVTTITGTAPLSATGGTTPTISISTATTSDRGAVRLATQTEATAGNDVTNALTPGTMKGALTTNGNSLLPLASTVKKGIIQVATLTEVIAGTNDDDAVTPKTLKDGLPSLAVTVPTGAIISYGGSTAPTGYLACDGATVSRTVYSALFAVIGVKFGIGDGATTFKLPTIATANQIMSCIKT